jgi:ubiquinone/menaquinone biosynthesis C-methylase UbiE
MRSKTTSWLAKRTDSAFMWDLILGPFYNRRILSAAGVMFTELVESLSPLRTGSKVLDVGCGPGHFTRMLAKENPGATVIGLDYSAGQIRSAQAFLKRDPCPNCSFQQGNAMELHFDEGSIDLVVSLFSLKHWPDLVRGLTEIRRILKPDGLTLVGEADPQASPEAARRFANGFAGRLWLFRTPYLHWMKKVVLAKGYTGAELEQISRKAGFSKVSLRKKEDWILVWVELKD